MRRLARTLHIAKRTEEAYVGWITRFLVFHRDRRWEWTHPSNRVLRVIRWLALTTIKKPAVKLRVLGLLIGIDTIYSAQSHQSRSIQSCESELYVEISLFRNRLKRIRWKTT
ncbi:MAG: hypothetical protein ACK5RF_03900 [Pirellula sp.]